MNGRTNWHGGRYVNRVDRKSTLWLWPITLPMTLDLDFNLKLSNTHISGMWGPIHKSIVSPKWCWAHYVTLDLQYGLALGVQHIPNTLAKMGYRFSTLGTLMGWLSILWCVYCHCTKNAIFKQSGNYASQYPTWNCWNHCMVVRPWAASEGDIKEHNCVTKWHLESPLSRSGDQKSYPKPHGHWLRMTTLRQDCPHIWISHWREYT